MELEGIELEEIQVFQGRGIGNRLMQNIISFTRGNYSFLAVSVFKDNEPALNLYHKHGFIICHKKHDAYLMCLLFSKKALSCASSCL